MAGFSSRMPLVQSMLPPFEASVASAFRTSDWDKPNCRAMRPGVMPTLKAARTAFSCPRVNETGASAVRLIRKCFPVSVVSLPRRFASAKVTASRRSNSSSLRCFTAFDKSLGRTCRGPSADET